MKLVAAVKLLPDDATALVNTVAAMNAAAQCVVDVAYDKRCFGKYGLQKLCYREIRDRFGLGAQAAIRTIAKAADAYADKTRRNRPSRIDPKGAVAFDDRNLAWNVDAGEVRIWTVAGRQRIRFVCGARQAKLLDNRKGESDLFCRDGEWFLVATIDVPEPTVNEVQDMIGVDMGQKYLAATSDGHLYGHEVAPVRARYDRLRRKLQANGSKSANRLLKKRRRKERRFVADVNHCIASKVVREAERTGSGVAIEDLDGIRERVTVRRSQRRAHHAWSYSQLRQFIEYKAALVGVAVVVIDPHYTSQRCPMCHYTSRRNRPTRDRFDCRVCGVVAQADVIAAANIAHLGWCEVDRRASVMRPYAERHPGSPSATHDRRPGQHRPSDRYRRSPVRAVPPGTRICKPPPLGGWS